MYSTGTASARSAHPNAASRTTAAHSFTRGQEVVLQIFHSYLADFCKMTNRHSPFVNISLPIMEPWNDGAMLMEPGANAFHSICPAPEPDSVTCAQQMYGPGEKERSFGFSMSMSAPRPLRKCCSGESCPCDSALVQRMPNPDNGRSNIPNLPNR